MCCKDVLPPLQIISMSAFYECQPHVLHTSKMEHALFKRATHDFFKGCFLKNSHVISRTLCIAISTLTNEIVTVELYWLLTGETDNLGIDRHG